MKKLFLLFLLGTIALNSQGPGNITITSTINAVSGTGASAVSCIISNPQRPTIRTICSINSIVVLSMDSTPAIGTGIGATGSFVSGANSITWIIQQPTAGVLSWQIAANGTSQNGSF